MIKYNLNNINDWNFDNANIAKVYYGVTSEPSYTQYEYVQGNGTSYIITDYYANDNTWAEVDIEGRKATSSTVSAGEAHPFGSYHNINGQVSHRFKWLYPGSTIFGSGGMRFDYKGLTAVTRGDSIILSRGIVKIDSSGGYIDDTKLVSFSDQSSTSFDGNMCPIGIFRNLEYNGTTIQPQVGSIAYNGKIYSVKIYEGNTLVRNYVPAIKDGVAGMFETITGVMYGSAVSTPFTVGGEATEIGGTNGNVVYQKIVTGDTPTPTATKWVATYQGGIITSASCDSTSAITVNEITKANLESVVIGNCVSAIVGECFSDCSKLSAATINGYTSIDDYCFARNNGTLKTIIMLSPTPPPCANTAFTYYNHGYVPMTSITIYVPAASVEAYKAASGWSRYADKIQAIP